MTQTEINKLEKAIDMTIEDMKHVFPFRHIGQYNKTKSIIINEQKIGTLRYLFLKNLKAVN